LPASGTIAVTPSISNMTIITSASIVGYLLFEVLYLFPQKYEHEA